MYLRELLQVLRTIPNPAIILPRGFGLPERWLGTRLLFGPRSKISVADMIFTARSSHGSMLDGRIITGDTWCDISGSYDLDSIFSALLDRRRTRPITAPMRPTHACLSSLPC